MEAPNTATSVDSASAEELSTKALQKRYEGLVMVRNKAIKGKGTWYWSHLEPMLLHNTETGLPKAVKLRCSLCEAIFSASNPSRTASEHFKRGTCPNVSALPKPISSVGPINIAASSSPSLANNRKRSSAPPSSYHVPTRFCGEVAYTSLPTTATTPHLMLSGGKEDLGALAMLEDSVKKLKSPKTSLAPALSKTQVDNAFDYLADWVYESCGSISFSCLEHPKFIAFLNQVGLPPVSPREFASTKLDAKFEEAKAESEARIRDAVFFQIASDGWKSKNKNHYGDENLVNVTINLPNGTTLYRRTVFVTGSAPSRYAEEILWETITGICGGNVLQQCVGIVADKFKAKALKNLENQNHWMVNLSCQHQGFNSLFKDFAKELPLFTTVTENCIKLANFVNYKSQVRSIFHKYQLQEYGHTWLLRVPLREFENFNYGNMYMMMDDILSSVRALHLVLLEEAFKLVSIEDPNAREFGDIIRDVGFWNDLEALHTLVKLVKDMIHEIETDRPLVGQCLLLWDELRAKVKEWCSKFHVAEGAMEKVIERRFQKNYHPTWAAAYILDPLYLVRDTSGKYLPPFKFLTPEQEKDVDKLITRLVSRDEAHIALMELMKWRTEGLDPMYARAVQMKERDSVTGKMRIANPQSSRLVWETYLTGFKSLGRVAARLIFLHATSCNFKCSWNLWTPLRGHGHSAIALDKVQKLIFIAAHSKLKRQDFSSEEDKEAELFTLANSEDDLFNEVLVDTSPV
ncbi:unnamed protein product [Lupinus luteus]|uniref:DUF7963 domain-containing protein n=1 Tax=Lupinus luteus TaxID=3873 RepID=A0AAV1YCE6_LUPLU